MFSNSIYLALFASFFLASVGFSSQIEKKDPWKCEKAVWRREPDLTDGLFSATIASTCWIEIERDSGIQWLFQRLQREYQRAEKYEIHLGPNVTQKGNLTVIHYDLTDKLSEEGDDLAIRQDVELKTDQKKELTYFTNSKEIQASGTAAYLKSVSFETTVKALTNAYQVELQNRVEIEKPWFALGFLFKPMSASITEEKFIKAQDKLIHYLLPES